MTTESRERRIATEIPDPLIDIDPSGIPQEEVQPAIAALDTLYNKIGFSELLRLMGHRYLDSWLNSQPTWHKDQDMHSTFWLASKLFFIADARIKELEAQVLQLEMERDLRTMTE